MLNIVLKPHRNSLKAGQSGEQKLFAMLKLIPDAATAKARPPLALALVVDTSASMQSYADQDEAKAIAQQRGQSGNAARVDGGNYRSFDFELPTLLDQAIQAAHTMVDDARLLPADQIAIIHFDDEARTLLSLTPVSQKLALHNAIESLRQYQGGTHMAKGLRNALGEMNRLGAEVAKRVIVLTDGETFDEDECSSLLPQFAASNTPLVGIGFGVEYNSELLKQMADASQGRPYHIMQMTDLGEVLQVEVGQTAREVVTDLKASIATVKGVKVESISRIHPAIIEVDNAQNPYRMGNIAAGDFTVFIIEMTIAGVERPPSRVRVAQIGLTATAPGLNRVQEFPPQNLFLDFTHDEAAIAAVDPEVIGYVQQKNVGRLVEDAVRLATTDAGRARQTLQVAVGMTQRLGNGAMTQILNNALGELDSKGTISVETGKTVALGLRTKTVKTATLDEGSGGLSPEELRRLSGT